MSDTYVLLLKSHVYHWNVVGPLFLDLHDLTEAQYPNLFAASDEIAERIRALGHKAPLSFKQMVPKAEVEEETASRSAEEMIAQLVGDHEQLSRRLRELSDVADEANDLVTVDLVTRRMAFHEKAAWMLRSLKA